MRFKKTKQNKTPSQTVSVRLSNQIISKYIEQLNKITKLTMSPYPRV